MRSWSPSEAAGVGEFLNSPLGQRWLKMLEESKPPLDMESTERAALTGAQASGYEKCLKRILISGTPQILDSMSVKGIDPTRD